jgi:hypothetical protein
MTTALVNPPPEPAILPESLSSSIPPPTSRHGGINGALRGLSVGESILINRAHTCGLFSRAHRVGIKIKTRVDPGNPSYVRVWRTA